MQFPKLTPLQSRFAASFAASCLLLLCFFSFSNPHFAYAADVDSIIPTDHNHPLVLQLRSIEGELPSQDDHTFDGQDQRYEPDFEGLGRSILGRQDSETVDLENNVPGNKSIALGDKQFWRFPKTALEGSQTPATPDLPPIPGKRSAEDGDTGHGGEEEVSQLKKRQSSVRTLYLTLNVCDQPSPANSQPSGPAPQLNVYVSQGSSNQRPGPDQTSLQIIGGAGNLTMTASDDVFVGVVATPDDNGFQGTYNYELTASIDAPYAFYQDLQELYYVDSDNSSATFVSTNLTAWNSSNGTRQQWLGTPAPFGLFVHPMSDAAFSGIFRSFCGLRNHAQIQSNFPGLNSTVDPSKPSVNATISNDAGALLKQDSYLTGLKSNTTYYAIMAIGSNFTSPSSGPSVNGGGTVWQNISFRTKSDGNCQIPRNLTFCTATNYAVPANPATFATAEALGTWYDGQALANFQFFNYSLDQIPCDTADTARYSLAVTCQNCTDAYKAWLCAVTMPRCVDYSAPPDNYTRPRNVYQAFVNGDAAPMRRPPDPTQLVVALNASRATAIDAVVQPGPYRELLPCKQLCYGLVQSCPASLQFACPLQKHGLEASYGEMLPDMQNGGAPMCNMPGWVTPFSGGLALRPGWGWALVGMSVVLLLGVGI